MLLDYKGLEGPRFTLDWKGWVFNSAMNATSKAIGLFDQDYIHNSKKLLNPLDNNVQTLRLGADMGLHQQICQVFNWFTKDEHVLLQEDYDRKD